MTVLLVESHVAAARALAGYLASLGHEVLVFASTDAARAALDAVVPDLALIDLTVSAAEGAALAAHLRELAGGRVRCVAMTARPFLDYQTARVFDATCAKPIDSRALASLLASCASRPGAAAS